MDLVIFFAIFAVPIVGLTLWFVGHRQGETVAVRTSVSPPLVAMTTTGTVGQRHHWHVVSQGDGQTVLRYERKPNGLFAILLLLLFIVPGIVYLIVAGERETLSVGTYAVSDQETLVQISANGPRGKAVSRILRDHLPPVAVQDFETPATEAPATETLAGSGVQDSEDDAVENQQILGPYGRPV